MRPSDKSTSASRPGAPGPSITVPPRSTVRAIAYLRQRPPARVVAPLCQPVFTHARGSSIRGIRTPRSHLTPGVRRVPLGVPDPVPRRHPPREPRAPARTGRAPDDRCARASLRVARSGADAKGWLADVAVLDPVSVGSGPARRVYNPRRRLPTVGLTRGRGAALVNGVETISDWRAHGHRAPHPVARRARHGRHRHKLDPAPGVRRRSFSPCAFTTRWSAQPPRRRGPRGRRGRPRAPHPRSRTRRWRSRRASTNAIRSG